MVNHKGCSISLSCRNSDYNTKSFYYAFIDAIMVMSYCFVCTSLLLTMSAYSSATKRLHNLHELVILFQHMHFAGKKVP